MVTKYFHIVLLYCYLKDLNTSSITGLRKLNTCGFWITFNQFIEKIICRLIDKYLLVVLFLFCLVTAGSCRTALFKPPARECNVYSASVCLSHSTASNLSNHYQPATRLRLHFGCLHVSIVYAHIVGSVLLESEKKPSMQSSEVAHH